MLHAVFILFLCVKHVYGLVFINILLSNSNEDQFQKYIRLSVHGNNEYFCRDYNDKLPSSYKYDNCTLLLGFLNDIYRMGHEKQYFSKEVLVLINNYNSMESIKRAFMNSTIELSGNTLNVAVEVYGQWDGKLELELYKWLFEENGKKQMSTVQHLLQYCGTHNEIQGDYVRVSV